MVDSILPMNDMATMAPMPMTLPSLGVNSSLDKTAQDFEAMFATQLLQPMFETVPVNQTFGGGHGEEIMRSFLLQEYGKMIAKTGRLGIASQVKAEMLRAQEGGRNPKSASDFLKAQNAYLNAASPAASSQGEKNVSH